MASGGFGYAVEARGVLADAVALLGDLGRSAELHPTLSGVEPVPPGPGALTAYRMVESTERGPLAFAVERRAELLRREQGDDWARIVTRERWAPRVRAWTETELVQRGDLLRGRVSITVQAPAWALGRALTRLRRRHEAALPLLIAELERRTSAIPR